MILHVLAAGYSLDKSKLLQLIVFSLYIISVIILSIKILSSSSEF